MKSSFYIQGMHCVSCEILAQKELQKIPGVTACSVSHKTGKAEIISAKTVPMQSFEKAVQSLGYTLSQEKPETHKPTHTNTVDDYIEIAAIAGVFIIAFLFLRTLNISQFLPNIQNNVSLFVALGLGVVASMSTCLALVGGIVLSFGSSYPVQTDVKHPFLSRAQPHIYFHLGRIGGFVLLGGILGMIGSTLKISLSFTGIFTLAVAAVMLYIGLQILGFVPSITKLGFHLPKGLSQLFHSAEGGNHPLTPMLLGIGTFFVPCGFTQSMQLAAIAAGNFFGGALIMGAFALGTLPMLFSLGLGSTYAQKSHSNFFHKVMGVFISFFALYSFGAGFTLAGFTVPSFPSSVAETSTKVEVQDSVQVVKMDVNEGFFPSVFAVKKGIPVRWEINGINISGCVNAIVVPKLGIEKQLQMGLNVVEFTPKESGVLPFSCWMGMVTGKFFVE